MFFKNAQTERAGMVPRFWRGERGGLASIIFLAGKNYAIFEKYPESSFQHHLSHH